MGIPVIIDNKRVHNYEFSGNSMSKAESNKVQEPGRLTRDFGATPSPWNFRLAVRAGAEGFLRRMVVSPTSGRVKIHF